MTASIIYGVYGASGCGRGVVPLLQEHLHNQSDVEIVFIDDGDVGKIVNDVRVLTYAEFLRSKPLRKKVTIAIADATIRKRLAEQCMADGLGFYTAKSIQHVAMKDIIIGEGAIFSPFTTVTSNIRIGSHFHCNIGSYVEHDCVIGDFVTFAPSVGCNGNVHIGDGAYIGTGAILKQGTPEKPLMIGAGAVVGMGAVVTKDVAPGSIVIGNPAKPMVK